MDKNYGGFVWTNHALARLRERGIKQGDAYATLRRPNESRYAQNKGAWVYYKTWGSERIEVVAKQNDKKEWIVLSVWSRPVRMGQGPRSTGSRTVDLNPRQQLNQNQKKISPWGMIKSLFTKSRG